MGATGRRRDRGPENLRRDESAIALAAVSRGLPAPAAPGPPRSLTKASAVLANWSTRLRTEDGRCGTDLAATARSLSAVKR